MVRRIHRPLVTHYVALSGDLERYLVDAIGVPPRRITRIVNGVDTERFSAPVTRAGADGCPFDGASLWRFGTVGRLQPVKHQTLLARAFVRLLERAPELRSRCRLLVVGEGPLRAEIAQILAHAGASDLVWMPGTRDDVPDVLRTLDVFVLPSLAEGISNTILEAMATGLPIIATNVGGNGELMEDGRTGMLVAPDDIEALATAMLRYADPAVARAAGAAGRQRVERLYRLDAMVASYGALYERLLAAAGGGSIVAPATRAVERVTGGGY